MIYTDLNKNPDNDIPTFKHTTRSILKSSLSCCYWISVLVLTDYESQETKKKQDRIY